MDLEESIVYGCCLRNFYGLDKISLLSYSYSTMTYKISLVDLCGKAPVKFLMPFLLILNGTVAAHNSCVFTDSMS